MMASEQDTNPQPPQPPTFERKLAIAPLQRIGVPLIMLLPILALFGVFGESVEHDRAANGQLAIEVEYPARLRFQMTDPMRVAVTNLGSDEALTVTVSFDRDYVEGFSAVTFAPDVERVTDRAYVVEVTGIEPGATQVVNVEWRADRYWRHRGLVAATPPEGEPVAVEVSTLVYP